MPYDLLLPSSDQQQIGSSSWFGFSFIINSESGRSRKELVERLMKYGVNVRPIVAENFINNEVIKYFNYDVAGDLVNANLLDSNGFFVGNHHFNVVEKL